MRHQLSEQQFNSFWQKTFPNKLSTQDDRKSAWNKNNFRDKFKLIYTESNINGNHIAYVLGSQKSINWFLLNLG